MGRQRKPVKKNPVGDSERFYGKSKEGMLGRSVFEKGDPRHGTSPTVSKYPGVVDIYAMINSVTKKQIQGYSNVADLPVLVRDLLFEFAEDWSNLDRDHSNYLSQVPEGYSKFDASLIGDFLYWMITGANERSKVKSGRFIADHHWPSKVKEHCPDFVKRLDSMPGLTIHDLPGLHIRILNNLPINSYNRYTIAQVTLDDPQIGEQVFPSPSPLSSEEHESIITLKRLIEAGDMRKFAVALTQSTKTDLSKLTGSGGVGTHIFQAFEMAKASVDAYKQGDVNLARKHLHAIQDEYKMNLSTFQTGLKDMFVLTASAFTEGHFIKGKAEPLLVSLDTSMPPVRSGWASSNMHAVMKAANQTDIEFIKESSDYDMVKKIGDSRGTLGLTSVVAGGNNILTTNWLGIFTAALSGIAPDSKDYLPDEHGKNKRPSKKRAIGAYWPKGQDSISIRFVIHANLAVGIGEDYLVPKGLLTVTARKGQGKRTWAEAIRSYGGKGGQQKKGGGNQSNNQQKKGGGKPLSQPIIDLFVEDLGRAKRYSDAFTTESQAASLEVISEDEEETLEEVFEAELGGATRGKVKVNPSGAIGKAVAIDVVPRSQIEVRSITEKHSNMQYLKQVRNEADLKELYDHYGKGQPPVKLKGKKYRWKGKVYGSKKQVMEAVNKSGNQIDKGHPKMQILYARRKDNGNLVPHRIILPRIMVRHNIEDGRLVANKGSKATAATRRLLKRIERDFGTIVFKKDLTDTGGYDVVKGKDDRGRNKTRNYNRGVAKLFEAKGHPPGTPKAGNLFVTQVSLNGTMYYDARMEGGRRMGPVSLKWQGASQ